jgi:hypothetical protein
VSGLIKPERRPVSAWFFVALTALAAAAILLYHPGPMRRWYPYQVSGHVLDAQTGRALAGVMVMTEYGEEGKPLDQTATDAHGSFRVGYDPKKRWSLAVYPTGYVERHFHGLSADTLTVRVDPLAQPG